MLPSSKLPNTGTYNTIFTFMSSKKRAVRKKTQAELWPIIKKIMKSLQRYIIGWNVTEGVTYKHELQQKTNITPFYDLES
jgi:hypothetical protein